VTRSRLPRSALHLAVLSSFAFAQPLFDLLGRNAAFFAVRGSGRWQIVAFALGVTVIPPLILVAAEVAAGFVRPVLQQALHLVFLAALTAVVALEALEHVSGAVWTAGAAAVAGLVFADAYRLFAPVRSFVTVLGPAPLVFVGLFLLNSPVSTLVVSGVPPLRLADVRADAPVVLVVFDEFSGTTLMDSHGALDAARFPSFARLARDATWYRNATTVNPWTTNAVPAILDGRFPRSHALPVYRDHPQSVFTLLGRRYAMNDHESFTHVCPPALCPPRTGPIPRGLGTLISDVAVVYGHLVLPTSLERHLPSIEGRWGNFRAERPRRVDDPTQQFEAFVRSLGASPRPTLSVLHVGLPHFPWQFLPNGKRYLATFEPVAGVGPGEMWGGDDWLALQGFQRYVLQVGYTDRLLGQLLRRLRATGLYDRSLLVVTADHGVSFRAGDGRRALTATNAPDIAFVPLFVKAPHQRRGGTVDAPVRTIDVLPTIAEALGVRTPWRVDGLPASARERSRSLARDDLTIDGKPFSAAELESRRRLALAHQIRLFGSGATWQKAYALGLDGLSLQRSGTAEGEHVRFDKGSTRTYDPAASLVPAYVTGTVEGRAAAPGQRLAIAVNGRIRAATRTYGLGGTRFAALVPESAFRPGRNILEAYLVTSHGLRRL
jgi:Sulfatase